MIQIDKQLIDDLFAKAEASDRKRMNYDLRTSVNDNSQRMLNALMPGSSVPIHRHPQSNENVICLCGKLVEVLYDDDMNETARFMLNPAVCNFGCVVPAGVWHTVEVLEPSVIYEAKDGAYGSDGSETLSEFQKVSKVSEVSSSLSEMKLKEQITYLIGMERQSGSMDNPSPLYISRMLNVPLADVEKAMREVGV